MKPEELNVKIFLDGADLSAMKDSIEKRPYVRGFTTNPSLMRKSGVTDYAAFAQEALGIVGDLSISFEVFSDDFEGMEREARIIADWGQGVYVKIPITNTKGQSALPLIEKLCRDGIKVNITAIMTDEQVKETLTAADSATPIIVSVFAGRIADTGRDPLGKMREYARLAQDKPQAELLWASTRELLNIVQADDVGCDIITVPPDLVSKLNLFGKDLNAYSLETVQAFYKDATASGFKL